MPAATLEIDPGGVVVAADDGAGAVFGCAPCELVGRPVDGLLKLGRGLDALWAGAERLDQLRVEGRRVNDVPFTADARLDLVGAGARRRARCVVVELDPESLVDEARRHFFAAFDNAPVGMGLFSPDGEYVRANAALCELLGRSERELLGRRDQEFTHPDDRAADVEAAWRVLRGELSSHQCEKRFVRPDGSLVCVLANLTFLRDEDGRPLSWVGQFQDITALRDMEAALRESEERHRLVVRNLPGAGVILYDRELRCMLIEGQHMDAAGLRGAEMIGRPMRELTSPEIVEQLEPLALRVLEGEHGTIEIYSSISGRLITADASPHRGSDGVIAGVLVVVRDVTAQRAAERARGAAERQFQVAFERAPIGMAIIALDGRFERVNAALCTITGHGAAELLAMDPFEVIHVDDREALRTTFTTFVASDDDTVTAEHRFPRGDDAPVWVDVKAALIRDGDGTPLHVLAQFQDITELRRREAELRHLADHDPLTGLLNRRAFHRALDQHVTVGRRYGLEGAVLVLDLDGFKQINDVHGHQAGDELISACARALNERLRESDQLARLGGDEFAALLPTGGVPEAETVAAALVDVVRSQRDHDASALPMTVSIGVAVLAAGDRGSDDVLARADRAMYAAKAAGRDRYTLAPARDPEPEPEPDGAV